MTDFLFGRAQGIVRGHSEVNLKRIGKIAAILLKIYGGKRKYFWVRAFFLLQILDPDPTKEPGSGPASLLLNIPRFNVVRTQAHLSGRQFLSNKEFCLLLSPS